MRNKQIYECNCGQCFDNFRKWRTHRRENGWIPAHYTYKIFPTVATPSITVPNTVSENSVLILSKVFIPSDTPIPSPNDHATPDSYLTYLSQFATVEVHRYGVVYHTILNRISVSASKRSPLVAMKRAVRRIKKTGFSNLMFYNIDKRYPIDSLLQGKMEDTLTQTRNTRVAITRIKALRNFGAVEYSLIHGWCQIYIDKKQVAEGRGPTSALRKALEALQRENGNHTDATDGDSNGDLINGSEDQAG